MDLDEVPIEELEKELARRQKLDIPKPIYGKDYWEWRRNQDW